MAEEIVQRTCLSKGTNLLDYEIPPRSLRGLEEASSSTSDRTVLERYFHRIWRYLGQRTAETLCGGLRRSRGDDGGTGKRITKYKQDGSRRITGRRRVAELGFVSLARAKMSENKGNGPEDSIVSEMIKQLSQEHIYEMTRLFPQHQRKGQEVTGPSR